MSHKPNKSLLVFGLFLFFLEVVEVKSAVINTNTFEGKSIGIINTLYRGESGLWLGGEKGVFRVRGNKLEKSAAFDSKYGFEVLDLVEDKTGTLWIASFGGGLHMINPGNGKVTDVLKLGEKLDCWDVSLSKLNRIIAACEHRLYSIDQKTLKSNNLLDKWNLKSLRGVTKSAIDGDDNIWFITLDYWIYIYNQESDEITSFDLEGFDIGSDVITDMFGDKSGNIWISSSSGVFYINREPMNVTKFKFPDKEKPSKVSTIFQDVAGKMWFAGDTLYELDASNTYLVVSDSIFPTWSNWKKGFINDVAGGARGELFLAANLFGLIELPPSSALVSLLVDEYGIPVKNISYSFLHSNKVIFSDGSDLFSYNVDNRKSIKLIENVGYINKSLDLGNGFVLLAIDRKGLHLLNTFSGSISSLNADELGLPNSVNSQLYSMARDEEGRVYLGYFGEDLKGVYLGTIDEGFIHVDSSIYVDEILKNRTENIFVATRKRGILQYSGLQEAASWGTSDSETELITNCLKESLDGTVWLCTNGKGLGYLDPLSQSIHFIDKKYTNDSTLIRDLVPDSQGYLWLMTGDGLIRFDPKTYDSISLGKEDGIFDTDFEITASLQLPDHKILVAGDHFNYIIDTRKANEYLDDRAEMTTNVVMTHLEVSNREKRLKVNDNERLYRAVYEKSPLTLTYDEFLFTFKFAANNYIERDNLGFEYRLRGLSDSWSRTKPEEASATYSTLPHGRYEFQVKVTDPKSHVAQPILSIPILVSPPFWLTWQAYLVYVGLLIVGVYIALRYRTQSLKNRNELLASEIKQRTKQLEESNQTVGRLLNQKEQFFENLSHEFKTPITLILGPIEKLKREHYSSEAQAAISVIEKSTHRLEHLVDQVMDLSKSNNFRESEKTTYFVYQSLEMMIEAFRPLVNSKKQHLIVNNRCHATLELYADSYEKIVTNLLSNAIKYSPEGGEISVTSQSVGNEYVLRVEDNGAGISESHKNKVFERFTRLAEAKTENGSGLGLAVTKDIVEANDGVIEIESKLGEGTTFIVTIPLGSECKVDSETTPRGDTCANSHVEEANGTLVLNDDMEKKKRLLVVEDNADMAKFIIECLEPFFLCEIAEDGSVGISKANHQIPDLIITDLMMPKVSGFELVDCLRESELTSHIPIIVLTAKGDKKSRISGWNKNVDDYVAKPFNAEELLARINRLLNIRDLIRESLAKEVLSNIEPKNQSDKYSFKSAKDRVFFEKFSDTIKSGYSDETFNRGKAAAQLVIPPFLTEVKSRG